MNDEEFIIFEAPIIQPIEFRLYYNDDGSVKYYCGDKSGEGNYIIIDAATFAQARYDVMVVEDKVVPAKPKHIVHKLMPVQNGGVPCHKEDLSIIVDDEMDCLKWNLVSYEL
jgi:hypothetical protein